MGLLEISQTLVEPEVVDAKASLYIDICKATSGTNSLNRMLVRRPSREDSTGLLSRWTL